MTTFTEESAYETQIYEISIDDMAMGGPGGVMNEQPSQLANRTRFLKDQQDAAHSSNGRHSGAAMATELAGALTSDEFSTEADINEAKINALFRGRPRATGTGVYSNTAELTTDLVELEIAKAEGDLLQSEVVLKTIGSIYQRVYGASGDIFPGATSLTGYDLVGEGGLFSKTVPTSVSVNRLHLEGDIRKLVDMYNIQPLTPTNIVFPDAEAEYTAPRTDLLYFRCHMECVSDSDQFFVHGDTASTLIEWDTLTSEERRVYMTGPSNNLFLRADSKIYQIQYAFVVAEGQTTMAGCGYTSDEMDSYLYFSGDYFASPICSVARRNQGAYHPEFNALGTGYFMVGGNPALDDTRFAIGDVNQIMTDNDDFSTWTAATGVTESSGLITGVEAESETIYKSMADADDSTRYVFFVDLKKNTDDAEARTIEIAMVVEDSSNAALVTKTVDVVLGADFTTAAISVETPSADTDHIVLKIGSGDSCDYAFYAQNARYSEDIVPAATPVDITATSTTANTITVLGDHREDFPIGWDVTLGGTVSGGYDNNGDFEVTDLVFDGTNTVIGLDPGITYNTGNTGQVESTLWHYINYCFTQQSEGIGGDTTGGILSGASGRFDSKYHDELDVESITEFRNVLEATGGLRPTLSTPVVSGLPTSANETDVLTITLSNYSADYTYNITVSVGTFERIGSTITWTLPEVETGSVTANIAMYVTNDEDEFSDILATNVVVYNVPIEGDSAIQDTSFTEAEFEVLSNVVVTDGDLVGSAADGYAVTTPYYQDEGDGDWATVKAGISIVPAIAKIDLTVTTGSTTSSSVVGTVATGAWAAEIGDQIGITVNGTDRVTELISASVSTGDPLDTLTLGITEQAAAPTAAWKPGPTVTAGLLDIDSATPLALTSHYADNLYPTSHTLTGGEDEYVAWEDIELTLDMDNTTTTSIVGTSTIAGLFSSTDLHNQVGLTVNGEDVIATIINVTTEVVGDDTTYTIAVSAQTAVPTAAWKPSQLLHSITLPVDTDNTTASSLVMVAYEDRVLLGRDSVEITVGGEQSIVEWSGFGWVANNNSAGVEFVFNGGTVAYTYDANPTDNKTITVYSDIGNSNYGTARLLGISGATITAIGSTRIFNTAETTLPVIAHLTDTKTLVAYSDAGNSGHGTAVVLDIEGISITSGTAFVFNANATSDFTITPLSETKALVVYSDDGNSGQGTAIILDVSGSTITAGTPFAFNAADTSNISVVTLSETLALVTYSDVGNSSYGTALVLTVSSSTITASGSEFAFNENTTLYTSVTSLSSTKAVVTYRDDGDAGKGTAIVLSISGSTVTAGTAFVFNAAQSDYISVVALTASEIMVTYGDAGNSGYGTFRILNITDSTITASESGLVFNEGDPLNFSVIRLTRNRAVATYKDGTTGYSSACALSLALTLTIPTQDSAPTAATLIGTEDLPSTITYDSDSDKLVVRYTDKDVTVDRDVRQLKFGIGNLDEDVTVDTLLVDLWRSY